MGNPGQRWVPETGHRGLCGGDREQDENKGCGRYGCAGVGTVHSGG